MAVLVSLNHSSIFLVTLPSNFASQHRYINPKKKKNTQDRSTTKCLKAEALNLFLLLLGINLFVNYKVLKLIETFFFLSWGLIFSF